MRYSLKVHSQTSGVTLMQIEAASPEEAMQQAKTQGYLPFSVEAASGGNSLSLGSLKLGVHKRNFSLLLFSQQWLSLLEAGLNLVEAIEALAEKETVSEMKAVLHGLLERMHAGQACSVAMEEMPDAFPSFFVATIRASERSGDIAESLRRYVTYQGQIEEVKKKVVSAMIYPLLLLAAGGLVTLFLLGYVVPKFSRIYEDRVTELPLLSQLLMEWGSLISHHGSEFFLALALALIFSIWGFAQPASRRWMMQRLWAMPGLGEKLRVYQLARLYRTLGMLLRGGTPIVQALDLVSGLLSLSLQEQLKKSTVLIREGCSISESLHNSDLTTSVSFRLLRVGEQSGQMGEMMERVAAFYDEEIARWIDVFTKVFEPLLMGFIGVMIGGIVILMYLPIFQLADTIQ